VDDLVRDALLTARAEVQRLRGGERRAGSHPAQFDHTVAHVSVLGHMGGSGGLVAGGNHLVGGAALGKLRIEFAAEFAKSAGSGIEAIDDGWINVFHGRRLLEGARTVSPDL